MDSPANPFDDIFDGPTASSGAGGTLSPSKPTPVAPTVPTKPVPPAPAKPPEDEALTAWKAWSSAPRDRDLTDSLLKAVRPSIDRAIAAHLGPTASNPVLRSRARQMALNALERYDPKVGASLSTYLVTQLSGLKRYNRHQTKAIRVPERAGHLNAKLLDARDELEDQLGREPSEAELSEFMGISPRKLARLRRQVLNEHAEGSLITPEGAPWQPAAAGSTSSPYWAEIVHGDLDPVNQVILEHTLGMFGKPVLSNQQIAQKLRLSPGAISQRKALIQSLLDKETELSPF